MKNAKEHVKKAKKALEAMSAGGKNNAAAAKQVSGNLTLAMNEMAAANSYVPVPPCRFDTEFDPASAAQNWQR